MSRLQKSNLLRWIFTGTLSKLRKCFPLYCVQGNLARFPCTQYKGSMKIGESLVLSTREFGDSLVLVQGNPRIYKGIQEFPCTQYKGLFCFKTKNKSYVPKHHIVQWRTLTITIGQIQQLRLAELFLGVLWHTMSPYVPKQVPTFVSAKFSQYFR